MERNGKILRRWRTSNTKEEKGKTKRRIPVGPCGSAYGFNKTSTNEGSFSLIALFNDEWQEVVVVPGNMETLHKILGGRDRNYHCYHF